MFRNTLGFREYHGLNRNIYKFKNDLFLGVAELIQQILFLLSNFPFPPFIQQDFFYEGLIRNTGWLLKLHDIRTPVP
jgi:hypothetical protein